MRRLFIALAGLLVIWLVDGCGAGAPAEYGRAGVDQLQIPTEDPAVDDFVERVDNPYFPLEPGSRWRYRSPDGARQLTASVPRTTRTIAGVDTVPLVTVARDRGGEVSQRREAWFAQDVDGNVWCFGATVTDYADGQPLQERAWEVGVDGAGAAMGMLAIPRIGDGYVGEDGPGTDRITARVVDLDRPVQAGATEREALITEEIDSRHPQRVDERAYARGIGLIAVESESADESLLLVRFSRGQ